MEPDEPGLADALIGYLRRHFDCPALEFDESPKLLALGTEASILAFSVRSAPDDLRGPLILRAMISGTFIDTIAVEHAVQNAVAEQGFPAPRAIVSSPSAQAIGRPFMVMTRLAGEHRPDLPDAVETQMEVLAKLHGLDPAPFSRTLELNGIAMPRASASGRLFEALDQARRWDLARFGPALEWLRRNAPDAAAEPVICHGDPHLSNMLFLEGRVSAVLDWGGARLNWPEMDVGLLCGYARCRPRSPTEPDDIAQRGVDRTIAAYRHHRRIDDDRVLYFETEFLVSVLVDMTDRLLRRRRSESLAANPILDDPSMAALIQRRLEDVTRAEVPLPEEAVS